MISRGPTDLSEFTQEIGLNDDANLHPLIARVNLLLWGRDNHKMCVPLYKFVAFYSSNLFFLRHQGLSVT